MEGSTPAKKKSFGFRRSSEEQKSAASSHSSKKKSREDFAADTSDDLAGTEQFCETPKASEDTESNQELQPAGKAKGKKWKKKHFRRFSLGGKFHKYKGKDAETVEREANTSDRGECIGTETISNGTQSPPINEPNDAKIEERRQENEDEAVKQTKESGDFPTVGSTRETVTEGDIFENVTAICDPEKIQVAGGGEAESSDPAENAVPALASEENFEVEDVTLVQGEKSTTKNEQNKHHIVPGPSSQSEDNNIGGHAFQMTKEEQATEIPSSPQNDEGDEVELESPTAAEDKSTSPKSLEAQEQSEKQAGAEEEEETFSPGISAIYQVLLHVKESLLSGEKQSSLHKISGMPYEICQLTVDTGRTKLSELLGFLFGQAGYSTRHVLSSFVKILIQKYPHCFQAKTQRKRKKSKGQRNVPRTPTVR